MNYVYTFLVKPKAFLTGINDVEFYTRTMRTHNFHNVDKII